MSDQFEKHPGSLMEMREARDHAEVVRDQLVAEYDRLHELGVMLADSGQDSERFSRGQEAMRKAIRAANLAIESIDQALREIGRVGDDPIES